MARSDRLLDGCRMSSAAAVMNTRALPDKLIADPELELSIGLRDNVVPEAVYVPAPISQFVPSSIVTAGTTWLGEEFDSALMNGALIEAIRFLKGEPDVVQNYEKMYLQSVTLLKGLGDGKLREDAYRSGQFRVPVS